MLVSVPQDFERDEERSANGGSDSDGEENIGWSTVNLDEEKQHQDVSRERGRAGREEEPETSGQALLAPGPEAHYLVSTALVWALVSLSVKVIVGSS